jgi:hypothetical protein
VITHDAPTVRKQAFGAHLVWLYRRHLTYATSCRTSELRTSGTVLDNSTHFQLRFCENIPGLLLTFGENLLGFAAKSLRTSP